MTEAELKAAIKELEAFARARGHHCLQANINVNSWSTMSVRGWISIAGSADIDADGETFEEVLAKMRAEAASRIPDEKMLDDILGISETWPPAPKEEAAA